jgi:hypothetical protein
MAAKSGLSEADKMLTPTMSGQASIRAGKFDGRRKVGGRVDSCFVAWNVMKEGLPAD